MKELNKHIKLIPTEVRDGKTVYLLPDTELGLRSYDCGIEVGVVRPIKKGKFAGQMQFTIVSYTTLQGLPNVIQNVVHKETNTDSYSGSVLDLVGVVQERLEMLGRARTSLMEVLQDA